jgi:hypothetical protein
MTPLLLAEPENQTRARAQSALHWTGATNERRRSTWKGRANCRHMPSYANVRDANPADASCSLCLDDDQSAALYRKTSCYWNVNQSGPFPIRSAAAPVGNKMKAA